jgi:hypothetical protein
VSAVIAEITTIELWEVRGALGFAFVIGVVYSGAEIRKLHG